MRVVGPGGCAAVLVVDHSYAEILVGGLDQNAEVAGAGVPAVFTHLLRLILLTGDGVRQRQLLTTLALRYVLLCKRQYTGYPVNSLFVHIITRLQTTM